VSVGGLRGSEDLLLGGVGLAVEDVFPDARGEEDRLLRYQTDLSAVPTQVQAPDVDTVEPDGSRERVIEPLDELDDGGLPRTALTHKGDSGSGWDLEGKVVEYGRVQPGGIGEGHMSKLQLPLHVGKLAPLALSVDGRGAVNHLKYGAARHAGINQAAEIGHGLPQAECTDEDAEEHDQHGAPCVVLGIL